MLLGILLAILGLPFLGMSLVGRLLSGALFAGFAGSAAVLVGVYALTGLQGAILAAVGGGIIAMAARERLRLDTAAALAAAGAVIAAVLSQGAPLDMLSISMEEHQLLRSIYTSAGFPADQARQFLRVTEYLAPGIGTVQIAAGSVAAAVFATAISNRPGIAALRYPRQLRLGLVPAWIMIGALLVNLLSGRLPDQAVQLSRNVLLFMMLPYAMIGGSIVREYLSGSPGATLLLVLILVIAPPIPLALVVVLGIMDTWFDLRKRISDRLKGDRDEGSSDNNDKGTG